MRTLFLRLSALFIAGTALSASLDDALDKFDDFLTVNALNGNVRARLSGTLDLEEYALTQPAPGLIYTERNSFFNPRLTLFLDAQFGANVYAFAQFRADRGFDPGYRDARASLDEYALRVTPWKDGRFSLQIGKFATVVGNWTGRHGSWENPFVTAPLPYENLTGMWDGSAADSLETLRDWANLYSGADKKELAEEKYLRIPVIWGPSYASGISVAGKIGQVEYAAEMKNASLSSSPESWDATQVQWQHPTFSGRLGWRPNETWNLGFSASSGCYLRPDAWVPPGQSLGDYRQTVLAQDISFEWHHWQLWAEVFEARFEVPGVGNADSLAYYLEAKYKFTPQLFGALRWNQQVFSSLPDEDYEERWSADTWRADLALGFRPTAHTQLKLQYSLDWHESDGGNFGNLFAAQFTLRF